MKSPNIQYLGLMIHDAARLLKSEFGRRARDQGLTLTQWRILGQLTHSDGLTQTALAARIEASPMTVSDTVDRLEGLGYVRREQDPADSRAKIVRITEKAEPLVEEVRGIANEVYDQALAGVSPEDREALIRVLRRIAANLDGAAAGDKDTRE